MDPTPVTEEVIIEEPAVAVDADARSEDSEPMEEETHDAEDQLKEPEPTLVPTDCSKVKPVFRNTDRRIEWDRSSSRR